MDTLPITTPRQAGIYVRQAREAQGLTRAALAKKAGVSERLLASLELGDATGIRLDKLLTIFNALGLALAAQGDRSLDCRKRIRPNLARREIANGQNITSDHYLRRACGDAHAK